MSFVEFHDVKKIYHMGEVEIPALQGVNFEIEKGEFCVIVGASGAGKTTILNILGGMDTLTEGKVLLDGKEISSYGKKQLTDYRRYDIGFVFQFYNLVGNLTALEMWSWHPRSAAIRWMQGRCLQTWGLQTGHRTSRRSFPAGNSSVWRSPVPLPKIQSFCCAMNQPARWITIQVRQC